MSRGYNARRKARRQARAAAEASESTQALPLGRRSIALLPIFIIAAILAAVGYLGFGSSAGTSKQQVRQEIAELLNGIPQRGAMLGSPKAPITVWVYADLECPTVRLFVENYLPSFVDGWVRANVVRLGYRSLQTDTADESTFFRQEIAALAAGRQDRMWDFLLTFARQQGEPRTDYADEAFIAGIAAQIPGMKLARWHRERDDAELSKRVALGVHSGRLHKFDSTPSFFISYSEGQRHRPDDGAEWAAMKRDVESTLQRNVDALQEETDEDFPTLKVPEPSFKN